MSPFQHPTKNFPSPTVQSWTQLSVPMLRLLHNFPFRSRMNKLLLPSQTKNLDTPSDDRVVTFCSPAGVSTTVPGLETPFSYTTRVWHKATGSKYRTITLSPITATADGVALVTSSGFLSMSVTVSSVTLTTLTLFLVKSHAHSVRGDITPTLWHLPTHVRVVCGVNLSPSQLTTDTPRPKPDSPPCGI